VVVRGARRPRQAAGVRLQWGDPIRRRWSGGRCVLGCWCWSGGHGRSAAHRRRSWLPVALEEGCGRRGQTKEERSARGDAAARDLAPEPRRSALLVGMGMEGGRARVWVAVGRWESGRGGWGLDRGRSWVWWWWGLRGCVFAVRWGSGARVPVRGVSRIRKLLLE